MVASRVWRIRKYEKKTARLLSLVIENKEKKIQTKMSLTNNHFIFKYNENHPKPAQDIAIGDLLWIQNCESNAMTDAKVLEITIENDEVCNLTTETGTVFVGNVLASCYVEPDTETLKIWLSHDIIHQINMPLQNLCHYFTSIARSSLFNQCIDYCIDFTHYITKK